jgi:hypothetical protein
MFGFSKTKELKKKISELQSSLSVAAWRAEALLSDLKKAEAKLSERHSRLMHLEFEHRSLIARYNRMVKEHNEMVDEFAYGGGGSNPFTPEELKILIGLCHPDKHGGKESANKMTQKLLAMRQ